MFNPAAAKKRCEAATPEPWETHQEGEGVNSVRVCKPYGDRGDCRAVGEAEILGVTRAQAEANADFIAHARSDLPAALEALEEAQGKLEAVENFTDGHYKDGICLICGAPGANHEEMSPGCWVLRLDRILRGSKEGE